MRRLIVSLIIPVSVAFLFILVLEFGVRVSLMNSMNFEIEMWKYAGKLKTVSNNIEIGHEHVPGSSAFLMGSDVSINSQKLRDREFSFKKPDGMTRILMLGDSLTFGWGVNIEDTTSKILEKSLGQQLGKNNVEVINAGVEVLLVLLFQDHVTLHFVDPEVEAGDVGIASVGEKIVQSIRVVVVKKIEERSTVSVELEAVAIS